MEHGYWWPWWNSRPENLENKSLVRWNQSPTVRVREVYYKWLLNNPSSSCLVECNKLYLLLLTEESFCYFVWILTFNFQCCGIAIWWVNTVNVVWPLQCILWISYCFSHCVLTGTKKTRPSSAPVSRSNKPQDVWDKVRLKCL